MKTNKEMLLTDPDTGAVTGLEPGTDIKSPAEQQSSKEYFDKQNQKIQKNLTRPMQKSRRNTIVICNLESWENISLFV